MITVREAREDDVEAIRELFLASYGQAYAYPQYYDTSKLKKMVFADNTMLLVAEETDSNRLVGTASVVMHVGAYNDLVGEFGRLVVDPTARNQGIGRKLMEGRLERVRDRLHLGLVENRVVHPYSQQISASQGFRCVGFLPLKLLTDKRECVALYVRHFGNALRLRQNHPRIIPEAHELAELAMDNLEMEPDAIVDTSSSPYPHDDRFELQDFETQGYATLLRLERGRVHNREVFGPLRLHYGLFQIRSRSSNYLVAREGKRLAGAVGFALDEAEKTVRVFELISASDRPIRFLLDNLNRVCRDELHAEYVEIDVNAHSPRMQRTLLELGYQPAGYVPALTFHQVERLDAVKMVRLFTPPVFGEVCLAPPSERIAELVTRQFAERVVAPRLVEAARGSSLFAGLNEHQSNRLGAGFTVESYRAGESIYSAGDKADGIHLILCGELDVLSSVGQAIATLRAGASFGECSLLKEANHTASAQARTDVEVATLPQQQIEILVRRHPDIAVVLYRNLACDLSCKLDVMNQRARENTAS